MSWEITQFNETPPTTNVVVTDQDTGSTIDLTITEGQGRSYNATGTVTYKLDPTQRDTLNQKVIPGIQAAAADLNLPQPGLLGPTDDLVLTIQSLAADWDAGTFDGVVQAALGGIATEVQAHALNGSIQVTAETNALFMYDDAGVYSSVEGLSIHRSPVTGLIEHSFSGRDAAGVLQGGSFEGVFTRPPSGPNIRWSNELRFGNRSLGAPVTPGDLPVVLALGEAVTGNMNAGFAMAMAAADKPKYLCVKHILEMFGASIACTVAILAAVGTGGWALAFAVIGSFGSKAYKILDLIMSHLGLW